MAPRGQARGIRGARNARGTHAATSTAELVVLRARVAELEEEKNTSTERINNLCAELSTIRIELEQQARLSADNGKKSAELKAKNQSLSDEVSALQSRLNVKTQELLSLKLDLVQPESDTRVTSTQNETFIKQNAEAEKQRVEAEDQRRVAEQQRELNSSTLDSLDRIVNDTQALSSLSDKQREVIKLMETVKAEYEQKVATFQEQLDKSTNEKRRAVGESTGLKILLGNKDRARQARMDRDAEEFEKLRRQIDDSESPDESVEEMIGSFFAGKSEMTHHESPEESVEGMADRFLAA